MLQQLCWPFTPTHAMPARGRVNPAGRSAAILQHRVLAGPPSRSFKDGRTGRKVEPFFPLRRSIQLCCPAFTVGWVAERACREIRQIRAAERLSNKTMVLFGSDERGGSLSVAPGAATFSVTAA